MNNDNFDSYVADFKAKNLKEKQEITMEQWPRNVKGKHFSTWVLYPAIWSTKGERKIKVFQI